MNMKISYLGAVENDLETYAEDASIYCACAGATPARFNRLEAVHNV